MLSDMLRVKKREVAVARERHPLAELRARARDLPPCRDFLGAVASEVCATHASSARPRQEPGVTPGIALIAEIKRASPSKGVLNATIDPVALAKTYASAGASALSVLTDRTFFGGSTGDLREARGAVTVPTLRKDFTIDAYQVWETRAIEADAILLIVRVLSREQLQELVGLAGELGLTALVEVHRDDELPNALDCKPRLIGVNCRDLDTFRVDREVCIQLVRDLPRDIGRVAESGIETRTDVERLAFCGYNAALVGEALVRSGDPASMIRELLGERRSGTPLLAPAKASDLVALPPLEDALGRQPEKRPQ
jgi:indole-3-glycerol phosphate synthase